MARSTKKEKELTIEEKLEQALVPEAEQPYPVPENWCWTYLGCISDIIMGQSPDGAATTDDPSFMPLIGGAADMGDLYPKATRYTKVPTKISNTGDIILCIRATLGRPIYSDKEYCLGRGVAAIRSDTNVKEFIRLGLKCFEQYLYDNAAGTTFAQVSSPVLKKMPFPIAPFAEQQRIVDRIESLFSKLDAAKEKAQAVVDGYENRKAAILHKAFTGELTAKWRKKSGTSKLNWEKTTLQECSSIIGDGLHGTPKFDENGRYYFVNGNNLSGIQIEIKGDTKKVNQKEYEKYKTVLSSDSTVLVSINGTLGKTAFYAGEKIVLGKSACYVTVNKRLSKEYLRYFFTSRLFIYYANQMATGSTIKNLGLKAIRNMPLSVPPREEQETIVEILDVLLERERNTKEVASRVVEQMDIMKKNVLALAFQGKLGTNDSADEKSEEMLKKAYRHDEK